jgi:hypothetical protein
MPMSLREEIRLLSMVDILGPLSDEEMEDLAKRAPDTFLEKDDILYSPKESSCGVRCGWPVAVAWASSTPELLPESTFLAHG